MNLFVDVYESYGAERSLKQALCLNNIVSCLTGIYSVLLNVCRMVRVG